MKSSINRKKQVLIYKTIIVLISLIVIIALAVHFSTRHSNTGSKTEKQDTQTDSGSDGSDTKSKTEESGSSEIKNINDLPPAPASNKEYIKCADGEYVTSNGYVMNIKDGIAYIDGTLIVNKTFSIPETYKANDPLNAEFSGWGRDGSEGGIEKEAIAALDELSSDASKEGLDIFLTSGYRCYEAQKDIYDSCVNTYGQQETDTFSSRPGCSEHQTGLAIDLNSLDETFNDTDEYKWLSENCYKYGFCIRFPMGEESYTGYMYESWHIRYVGRELAELLYNNGDWLSLEHYFGITSTYE